MNKSILILEKMDIIEALEVKNLGVLGNTLFLDINGTRYGYSANHPEGHGIEKISKQFDDMSKHSVGKALAWLKTVTKLESGSVKGVPKTIRGTPAELHYKKIG